MLVAGRVVSGVSVGIASATVPLYQSEITAPSIRGRLVSLQQWSVRIVLYCADILIRTTTGLSPGEFCCSTLSSLVAATLMVSRLSEFHGAFK